MAKPVISTKRVAISKANAQVVAVVGVASFVAVFCLVASKAVISQNQYQARVTTTKEQAHRDLQKNIKAFHDLNISYGKFDAQQPNVIGGDKNGTGDKDGTNSKIVLDALPSTYDFPALASSVEKLLQDQGLTISSITGSDDQITQQGVGTSPKPQPVTIPFTFSVKNANYDAINKLFDTLEKSIRPIQIDDVNISGNTSNITLKVAAHTYYQPGKDVSIKTQVQK